MDAIILYSLLIYFFYHVASRSDLFKRPRAWVTMALPAWVVYILNCAFCWTFWASCLVMILGWVFNGYVILSLSCLFVAPVINLVVDLIVQALIRYNTPPMLVTRSGDSTPQVVFTYNGSPDREKISHTGCSKNEESSLRPFNPLNHEQTK